MDEEIESFPLKFSGDGGVYFGVWLVNLLLTIVTLGLFTPFARRRTLKYFYGHTVVAGSPLEFTGKLRNMFFGFLLVFAFYLAYQIASATGQTVAVGIFGIASLALAPFLWGSAMRFRLASTRWRGIRGRFAASWGEIYRASWPFLLLIVAWFPAGLGAALGKAALVAMGVVTAVLVWWSILRLEYNYKRLLIRRAEFGGLSSRWVPQFADFVKITLASLGMFLAVVAVVAGVLALIAGGSFATLASGLKHKNAMAGVMAVVLVIGALLGVLLAAGPARAYREARLYRLIWNNAGLGPVARFKCELNVWRYVRLRLKNMLLSFITGGFWRPFAITSEYQMKLESVTLHVKGGLDQLAGQLVEQQGALGDAVADAVGLDIVG